MSELSEAEIKALIAKVRSIKEQVAGILKSLYSASDVTEILLTRVLLADMKELVKAYNDTRNYFLGKIFDIGQHMPAIDLYGKNLDLALESHPSSIFRTIIIGCNIAEEGLKALLKSRLEPEVLDRLESYRKELEKLEEEGLDINVVKTLRAALTEAECGHWLASAIISSRVVDYVRDKINGEKDEDKVKFLVDNNIIPRKDKKLQELLLRTLKLHRNFLVHRVDTFPEVDEALVMLGGALSFAKILLKLKSS